MGLIFFTYFGAVLLLVNSSYLSFHQSNRISVLLNRITLPAAAIALCIAVSVHLAFYGQTGIQRIVATGAWLFMLLASYHILDMVFVIAEVKAYKVLQKINAVFHIAGIGLIVFYIGRFQWNPLRGFYFLPRDIVKGLSGARLFMYIYIFFVPVFSIILCFVKMFFVKSNIHRQQLLLHGQDAVVFHCQSRHDDNKHKAPGEKKPDNLPSQDAHNAAPTVEKNHA